MKVHVVMYTKPGCHLCDEMKQQIAAAGCDQFFDFEEVNIETDPHLMSRFRYDIPVLFLNGAEAFRHRLAPDDFRNAVRAAIQSKTPREHVSRS